ncbi:hypothetical protein SBA4_6580002 [Candidatus Sulfopaludibacter sp. SbA4]|nr:hypothetical protein SBA4_6580002 [Candidatus Sulfopaludibacter sp. SbA4]
MFGQERYHGGIRRQYVVPPHLAQEGLMMGGEFRHLLLKALEDRSALSGLRPARHCLK